MMRIRSIRFRLICWYTGGLVAVFVLFGASAHFGLQHYLRRDLEESLSLRAEQIGTTLLPEVTRKGEAFLADQMRTGYAPELTRHFVRITRASGNLLYLSGEPLDRSFNPSQVPPVKTEVTRAFFREERHCGAEPLLISAMPFVSINGDRFLIEVGTPTGSIQNALRGLLLMLSLGLPLVIAITVGGGYLLLGRALHPIDEIMRVAEEITLHNLSKRLPVAATGDEFERLSLVLNRMIARLEEAFQHTSRFSADASHELRTPLTIIRGELEAAVQYPDLEPELRERIGSMLEEVERLAKIVEGLFALSRLDAGEAAAERVRVNLAELAETTASQMHLLAEEKKIAFSCATQGRVEVEGDKARLKQVIVNLIDNAVKYTPTGGRISLQVFSANGRAFLEVVDSGIGIPAEAIPHIFERFFRADKVRSREMGGAGLGLSIVRSICTAHGGHVDVKSTEGAGTTVKIQLPLAS